MITNGSNLTLKTNHENVYKQQYCLPISQLHVYNAYKLRRHLGEKTFQDIVKIESHLSPCILVC